MVFRVTLDAREETAFFDAFCQVFMQYFTLPVRVSEPQADGGQLRELFKQFTDATRLHQLESPLKDDWFRVFKSTGLFVTPNDFLKVVKRNCGNPGIISLNGNTFDLFENSVYDNEGHQKFNNKDIGVYLLALNKIMVEWVQGKNSIARTEVDTLLTTTLWMSPSLCW